MISKPTPRTDAVYLEHRHCANENEATEAIEDLRDIARKLESELGSTTSEPDANGSANARLAWWKVRADELHEELATERAKVRTLSEALAFIVKHGGMTHDTECGEIRCTGFWCAEQSRAALAATEDK